jgi:Flp pilus assembly protein TadD
VVAVVVAREGPDMIVLAFLRWRHGPRPDSALLGSPLFLRRRSRTLLYLLPIALGGCASMMHQADSPTPQTSANGAVIPAQSQDASLGMGSHGKKTAADTPGGGRDRNGFSDKLTPEQEYNAHLELGRFQESQENFDLALGEYLKALQASESHSTLLGGAKNGTKQALAHRRMGSALDRLGRFEQAENEYSTALKLSPNDPKTWNDAGYSFYMQGRWADAERALKTAAKLDPHNTKIMTNLGLNLAASGKSDEALAEFTKAGGHAVGHANLAYILAAMGKTAEAEKHYKLALEFQPQLEPAKAALTALGARTAHEAQLAAASRATTATAPLLIDRPDVLPVAALRQPPPSPTTMMPLAPAPTAPVAALRQPQPLGNTLVPLTPAPTAPVAALQQPQPSGNTLVPPTPARMAPVAVLRQPPPGTTLVPLTPAPTAPVATLRQPQPSGNTLAPPTPARMAPVATLRLPPPSGTTREPQSPATTAPLTALRLPPPSGTTLAAQPPRPSALAPARWPNPQGPVKTASTPSQSPLATRVTPPKAVDPAVNRTAAPAPTRVPIPAPMPRPGPVPPFVPPPSN